MLKLSGKRSQFPNKMDEIQEMFTLPNSKKSDVIEYQELLLKDSLTEKEKLRFQQLSDSLKSHIFDVEKWNLFGDILVNMQGFFKQDVEPYIEDKKQEFDVEVGKFAYKGEWKPKVRYEEKNIVRFAGETYIAIANNTNTDPQNEQVWSKIAEKGEKGEPSLNINYKGEYNSNTSYVLGDSITFGGLWYYAKKETKNNPPTNVEFWELQSNQALVSNVKPFDNRVTIWIEI